MQYSTVRYTYMYVYVRTTDTSTVRVVVDNDNDNFIKINATTLKIKTRKHPLYSWTATEEVDREREVRTRFLALLRLEPALINILAFARARVKPNKR